MLGGLARRLLLVASIGLLVVGKPLPEAMVPPGPMMLQGAAADDQSARSERSANLSHITGTARKIRMYIKNRYLQLMPDGQVNGTNLSELSDYTILQRSSVKAGQVKIQGVATCMHLCMDICGHLYGSRKFNDECVFNEMIEQNYYNMYSSAKYSNQRRTLYLALNVKGHPRRVLIKAKTSLGSLSTCTRVLTQTVPPPPSGVEQQPHTCPPVPQTQNGTEIESPKCKRKRKKKKRRRCPENSRRPCKVDKDNISHEDGEGSGDEGAKKTLISRRKCEEENCRTKKLLMIGRKRKSRNGAGANTGSIPHAQPQHPHDGQHHTIKRTRHLHHLRHTHAPHPDEDEEDLPEHDFDDHDEDNDDQNNNNNNNNNNLATTIDPNNEDVIEELTTDHQQFIELLETNDK